MAVDDNMETCTRTDKEHDPWWMVDLRETKAIYAINFSFRLYSEDLRSRQQDRLSGYSIYVSNSQAKESGELCFKHNGSYLPSLTTEHVCASFGRYIQFVNNKLTFIELCNLVVLGCDKRGYYGDNCNIWCPEHCKNDQCFVTNGTCLGCASGWTGIKCDQACSNGKYGPDCSLPCSGHCKHNLTCNPINGTCLNGCSDGWMGVSCNKSKPLLQTLIE
ncbi:multiple epidermal growth factor-like domains protein 10 [Saccostrea cucullata]|uniref:multiple epidermal growth factor-like domains protein 10 n=1 Tax=Saccostrea cuccullata TaxID=36930 RepID=UPI002ED628E2